MSVLKPGLHVSVTAAGAARTIIGEIGQTSTTMTLRSFFFFLRFFSAVSVAAVIVSARMRTSAVSVVFVSVHLLLHFFAMFAKSSEAFVFRQNP